MDMIGFFIIIVAIGMFMTIVGAFLDPTDSPVMLIGLLIIIFSLVMMLFIGGFLSFVFPEKLL